MNIEIYDKNVRFASTKARVLNTQTSEKNKELLLDFAEDCLVGFNTPRLGQTSGYHPAYAASARNHCC